MLSCQIAIIGAGPVGLEGALYARRAGYDVLLIEQGEVAANVANWGHVLLFSPFGMNSSDQGRQAIQTTWPEKVLPDDGAYLTGKEHRDQYLLPLSQLPELQDCIREQCVVRGIGRSRFLKSDLLDNTKRSAEPFRLLVEHEGQETVIEADLVLDCSGTFGTHNWLGNGGIPAPGERQVLSAENYLLPDILNSEHARFLGKRTLVVGSGYSAATAVVNLEKLAALDPHTKVEWVIRRNCSEPIPEIENDPLAERSRITHMANLAVQEENGATTLHAGYVVERLGYDTETATCRVHLVHTDKTTKPESLELIVDQVLALVGYHPDRKMYEELQVHECYATQGPMKLAASLLGDTSADCLQQSGPEANLLVNPEPNFYILGAKSYGRDSRFLIQLGLKQIEAVFSLIESDSSTQREPV